MSNTTPSVEHSAENTLKKIGGQEKRHEKTHDFIRAGGFDHLYTPEDRAIIQAARAKAKAASKAVKVTPTVLAARLKKELK